VLAICGWLTTSSDLLFRPDRDLRGPRAPLAWRGEQKRRRECRVGDEAAAVVGMR
jgi:hypothetical protein